MRACTKSSARSESYLSSNSAAESCTYIYIYIFFFLFSFFFGRRSEVAALTLIFNSRIRRCNSFKNYANVFIGPWPPSDNTMISESANNFESNNNGSCKLNKPR